MRRPPRRHLGSRLLAGAVVAASLSTAGCGDDGGSAVTTEPTSTTTEATTTTIGTTTTPPACPPVEEPAGPGAVERSADVDGDGGADVVRTEQTDPAVDEWTLTVVLAAGGGAADAVHGDGVATVMVLGGYDLDGDGADEIWLRVGAGASATILGLFRLDGCALERVTSEGGAPVELPVGGSVGSSTGVGCDAEPDADVTAYVASLVPGEPGPRYQLSATHHRLEDGVLVVNGTSGPSAPVSDPDFGVYAAFDCGDLTL